MITLRDALDPAFELYEIPDDDLVGEVLVPAMSCADEVRIGAGFFTSQCLAQVAPGLAAYLNEGDRRLELLISPVISEEDREAIERAMKTPEQVVQECADLLFEEARLSQAKVVRHAISCLAYLLAADRLDLRFVLMAAGQYHKKQWLIRQGQDWLAVHGSGNATTRGLLVNGENMTIDRAWRDGIASEARVRRLINQWDRQWNNQHRYSLTVSAPQALRLLREMRPLVIPTVADFWDAWRQDHADGLEPELPPNLVLSANHVLEIPPGLDWINGDFSHQGKAVDVYRRNGGRGVLAIATGGGKTKTALISAVQYQEDIDGPMLIVILVPSKPLMLQWADEVVEFGVTPVVPSTMTPDRRRVRLQEVRAGLSSGGRRTEVLVVTNALFASDRAIRDLVDSCSSEATTMLIGDEVHNLGAPSFISDPPDVFHYRLGLSATPIRQYDLDGSDRLFDFFGPQVFEFTLGEAIKAGCLVPYEYHLHKVSLNDDEMDRYVELSEKLRKIGFVTSDDGRDAVSDNRVAGLLRDRRSVLEHVDEKLTMLRSLLIATGPDHVNRTLIYTSGKQTPPGKVRQIESVNALLAELGIISHQYTNSETSRGDANALLQKFGSGDYQVLTAMKVLDEGVDIPQTDTAFVLASSTVRREWVQRRGRILRRSPGKERAILHDFFVVPPDPDTREGRSVLRGELARAEEFTSLALNEWDPFGPRAGIIATYEDLLYQGGRDNGNH
jgi:superfamily II DNA or RNA helicase